MRAQVLEAEGDRDGAAAALTLALVYDPDSYRLNVSLAALALELGRGARVDRLLTKAIQLEPRRAAAWRLRGELLAQDERIAEALKAYERAIAVEPASEDAVRAAVALAELEVSRGHTGRAGEVLARAADHGPRAVEALVALETARGDPEAASLAMVRGLARFPSDAALIAAAIEAHARAGRFTVAALLAEARAQADSASDEALIEAYSLARAADRDDAARVLTDRLGARGMTCEARWGLSLADHAAGSANRGGAACTGPLPARPSILRPAEPWTPVKLPLDGLTALGNAAEVSRVLAAAHVETKADIQARFGSLVRAERSLEKLTDPDAVAMLARLRIARKARLAETEALIRGALARAPDHPGLAGALGRLAIAQSRHDIGARLLARAAWLAPDDALAHEHHGDALLAIGDRPAAQIAYARAEALLEKDRSPDAPARLARVRQKKAP